MKKEPICGKLLEKLSRSPINEFRNKDHPHGINIQTKIKEALEEIGNNHPGDKRRYLISDYVQNEQTVGFGRRRSETD
jgi:hypothetical protein